MEANDISRVWGMAQLATPMALRVAATLRLAERTAETPATAGELAVTVGVRPDALEPVLRHLAFRGVFRSDADGRFSPTALGETLRADHPGGLHALLDADSAIGRGDLAFVQLLHCVRTGQAGYPEQYGRGFWDDLAGSAELSATFYDQMSSQVLAHGPAVVAAYPWDRLDRIVDVGGGDASLLVALLTKYPDLRGTVVDQEGPAVTARRAIESARLGGRADVVVGSFFDPLPPGADGYLLSQILHDWDDAEARAILVRCAEAAGPSGRVFVVERTGADGAALHAAMDLRMMVYFGGRERTEQRYAELGAAAGLELAGAHDAAPLTVLEFVAATR